LLLVVAISLNTAALQDIEAWNDTLYNGLNNGVYRCGFAQSQAGLR